MTTQSTAEDIMQRSLYSVTREEPLTELEWELCRRRISGAPVIEDGRLVGIVTRADIARRVGLGHLLSDLVVDYYRALEGRLDPPPDTPESVARFDETLGKHLKGLVVADAMTSDPVTVTPQTPIAEVARLMLQHRIHRVVVVDDETPVGLVATPELLRLLERQE